MKEQHPPTHDRAFWQRQKEQEQEDREYMDWCLDGSLGDQPARRLSKQEQAKARRFSPRGQEERAQLESAIATVIGPFATREEELAAEELAQTRLKDLGLFTLSESPAMQFIHRRLHGVTPDEFEAAGKLAMVDLIKSEVPLDRRVRQLIAGELYSLYFPNSARDHRTKQQNEIAMIESMKRHLLHEGKTAAEADKRIAGVLGISVEALQKRMQPGRRKF
jgi:hypothetical protein